MTKEQELQFSYKDYPLLKKFVDYMELNIDSPREYHILNGLTLFSLFMYPWYYKVGESKERLLLWTLVLDQSATNHKSILLSYLIKFVRAIDSKLILSSEFTAEALFSMLKVEPPPELTKEEQAKTIFSHEVIASIKDPLPRIGLVVEDEFSRFLDMMNKKYNQGLEQMLTKIYDCRHPISRETVGQKRQELFGYMPMALASPPNWFLDRSAEKENSFTQGFLNRILIDFAPEKIEYYSRLRIKTLEEEALSQQYFIDIVNGLKTLYTTQPKNDQLVFTEEAREKYMEYEKEFDFGLTKKIEQDSYLHSLFKRAPDHTLKISGILAAIRTLDTKESFSPLRPNEIDIVVAKNMVKERNDRTFQNLKLNMKTKELKNSERITLYLEKRKCKVSYREIKNNLNLNNRDWEDALKNLSDKVEQTTITGKKKFIDALIHIKYTEDYIKPDIGDALLPD